MTPQDAFVIGTMCVTFAGVWALAQGLTRFVLWGIGREKDG